MAYRKKEKMARVIKEAVSDIIQNRLQDPRIEGFVSVTDVKLPSDMRHADVYLSVMGVDEKTQRKTFSAIQHAAGHIQSMTGNYVRSRFCPHLVFHEDKRLKKTMETMKIINELSEELKRSSPPGDEGEPNDQEI